MSTTLLSNRIPPWLFLMGVVTAIGPLAVDMYLPSFPFIAQDFGVPTSQIERTLAGYLLGLSIAQLAYGPLTDRFGRKIPLVTGLSIFIVASLMSCLASSASELTFWRVIQAFGSAAGMMVVVWFMVYRKLPELQPNFSGSYRQLMSSVAYLARTQPVLQLASFRGAMAFGSMSALFTTLVFHMEGPPFNVGASVVGSFGLAGAVGALVAAKVGKLQQHMSLNRIALYSLIILTMSWVFTYFAGDTYWGLIVGVILVDLGVQASHIMNQTNYFLLKTNAVNRLNTVYMVSYFIGGSLGTWLASIAWQHAQWTGVCMVGATFGLLAIAAHLLFAKRVDPAS